MEDNGGKRTMEVKIIYDATELFKRAQEDILNGEFYVYSA